MIKWATVILLSFCPQTSLCSCMLGWRWDKEVRVKTVGLGVCLKGGRVIVQCVKLKLRYQIRMFQNQVEACISVAAAPNLCCSFLYIFTLLSCCCANRSYATKQTGGSDDQSLIGMNWEMKRWEGQRNSLTEFRKTKEEAQKGKKCVCV